MRSMPARRRRGCRLLPRSQRLRSAPEDFHAVIDGMEMDLEQDIRAPDLATLDLYCDRVASAVGRLSVRVFGMGGGGRDAGASSGPRPAAHQYPARYRRGRRDRPALSAARGSRAAGIATTRTAAVLADPALARACAPWPPRGPRSFRRGRRASWRALPAPRYRGAAAHGRGLSPHPAGLRRAAGAPPRTRSRSAARLFWIASRDGLI